LASPQHWIEIIIERFALPLTLAKAPAGRNILETFLDGAGNFISVFIVQNLHPSYNYYFIKCIRVALKKTTYGKKQTYS
jgi:hypothetical protein